MDARLNEVMTKGDAMKKGTQAYTGGLETRPKEVEVRLAHGLSAKLEVRLAHGLSAKLVRG